MELIDPTDPRLSKRRVLARRILIVLNTIAFSWAVSAAIGLEFVPFSPLRDGFYQTEYARELIKTHLWISSAFSLAMIGGLSFRATRVFTNPIFLLLIMLGTYSEMVVGYAVSLDAKFFLLYPSFLVLAVLHFVTFLAGIGHSNPYPQSIGKPVIVVMSKWQPLNIVLIPLFSGFLYCLVLVGADFELGVLSRGLTPVEGYELVLLKMIGEHLVVFVPVFAIVIIPILLNLAILFLCLAAIRRCFAVGIYKQHPMEHKILPKKMRGRENVKISRAGMVLMILSVVGFTGLLAVETHFSLRLIERYSDTWFIRSMSEAVEYRSSTDSLFKDPPQNSGSLVGWNVP